MKYIVNGLFLTQRISGVQRYAIEILKELDKINKKQISIAVPEKSTITNELELNSIPTMRFGSHNDRIWENIDYYRLLRREDAIGINLCNTAPFLNVGIIAIHDVGFKNRKVIKELGGKEFKCFLRDIQNKIYCKNAKQVITVSSFSKQEIEKYYKCKNNIAVVPNAWQHYNDIKEKKIFRKDKRIKNGQFYFALSNLSEHKNFSWIMNEALNNTNDIFVVAGGEDPRHFKFSSDFEQLENVIYVGRISDEEAKALMTDCRAFVSPSLYEGFGLCPLEALCTGADIIVSDIPAHREVYADAAVYIDPRKTDYCLSDFCFPGREKINRVLDRFSWSDSALKLYSLLEE